MHPPERAVNVGQLHIKIRRGAGEMQARGQEPIGEIEFSDADEGRLNLHYFSAGTSDFLGRDIGRALLFAKVSRARGDILISRRGYYGNSGPGSCSRDVNF